MGPKICRADFRCSIDNITFRELIPIAVKRSGDIFWPTTSLTLPTIFWPLIHQEMSSPIFSRPLFLVIAWLKLIIWGHRQLAPEIVLCTLTSIDVGDLQSALHISPIISILSETDSQQENQKIQKTALLYNGNLLLFYLEGMGVTHIILHKMK